MSEAPENTGVETETGSPDWRQVAIVALAVLSLLVAAFAVPPLAGGEQQSTDPSSGGGSVDVGGRTGGGGGGGGGTGSGDTRSGNGESGGGVGEPDGGSGGSGTDRFVVRDPDGRTIRPDEAPPLGPADVRSELPNGCWVVAHSRPVPGTTLRVSVWRDYEPVPDRRVWFNGDLVGRTNELGTVAGTVPYESEFEVAVGVPNCRFVTASTDGGTGRDPGPAAVAASEWSESRDPGPARRSSAAMVPLTLKPSDSARGSKDASHSIGSGGDPFATGTPPANETVSNTYKLEGDIELTIEGTPTPGTTVTVLATLGGEPVGDGRVSVDGTRVGRTDESGRYRLTVPSDGREAITIRVKRGDFTGRTSVPIHDLELALTPARPLPVPGQRAVAKVTVAGQPVRDAVVSLAGERVGRTDRNGTLAFTIPAAPTATVRASARGQRASAAVWPLFVPTALVLLLTVLGGAVLTARAWRQQGRAAGRRRGAVAGGATTVLLGYVLGGGQGALLAGVALGLVGLAVIWRRSEPTAGGVLLAARAGLRAALQALRRGILDGVDLVGALVDRCRALAHRLLGLVHRVGTWLAAQPRSVGLLLRRAGGWLRRLPGRVGGRLRTALGWARHLAFGEVRARYSHRRLAVVLVAVALVATATWQWGRPAGLAVGLGFLVALAGYLLRRAREREEPETTAGRDGTARPTPSADAGDGASRSRLPLRELWRRFARAVAPRRWRTRTPAEIARAAVDRGLPAEPVVRLTEAFREVEYGADQLSEAEESTARTAYRTVRDALGGGREGDRK